MSLFQSKYEENEFSLTKLEQTGAQNEQTYLNDIRNHYEIYDSLESNKID